MSTFKGLVKEFPRIRIDYFRTIPGTPPPLACFLSHVHSDHLLGLDSLKSPFVYCAPATREILLRLEKYGHRMNFARGILECRKQTYKHLKSLLKTIPLETPTVIELHPGNDIQITLFDANHCTGSVMFLMQGSGKAILYTGDTRSEPWLVDSIARHPAMLPFSSGILQLDQMYLDTTFAVKDDPYLDFPAKAAGLEELLKSIADYPQDTQFYFNAWTFGYEDVWLLLSQALKSPVHLDRYRHGIYSSLSKAAETGVDCREAFALCGFKLGNNRTPGCITRDSSVRLHSCERGTDCQVFRESNNVVTITPIISRHNGKDMLELGAGGGRGDLNQIHELDLRDPNSAAQLIQLCTKNIQDAAAKTQIIDILADAIVEGKASIALDASATIAPALMDELSLPDAMELVKSLALKTTADSRPNINTATAIPSANTSRPLIRGITFPYSRHSSYSELRYLVAAFHPRDIHPCTVPPPQQWTEDISMEALFGDLVPVNSGELRQREFVHDVRMRALRADLGLLDAAACGEKRKVGDDETQENEEEETEDEETGAESQQSVNMSEAEVRRLRRLRRIEAFEAARARRWGEAAPELVMAAGGCSQASEEL